MDDKLVAESDNGGTYRGEREQKASNHPGSQNRSMKKPKKYAYRETGIGDFQQTGVPDFMGKLPVDNKHLVENNNSGTHRGEQDQNASNHSNA
ncbi:MAG: hypothetical protein LBQ88_12840 [Treponema sp.]|nr:hypothetical protein [Treponema sp.]